ncbi:hypothetical protein AURDEDRAFT_115698 [Auricularia subglabra TFB-10046 SS5]|uniref:FHA domain-containing protein n=1 Tax=Auricularia subglabra (strain TFB-10046 / SS5) TaxID=717982 RepID=J0DCS8_AURST|nr:hypothetical protein AURDEDRAFT_115698 [Auricularia subglabra TFB-10046 SS5]
MSSPSASDTDNEIQFMGMRTAPVVPKPSAITLTVESGDAAEPRTFSKETTRTVNIGRVTAEHAQRFSTHPGQLVFVCPVMSRQHARITFAENGQVFLADLNSHHGTVIARGDPAPAYIHLVPGDKYALYDGDLLTFGKTVYKSQQPHEPVSVRLSFTTTLPATVSASPGPVRYGLIDSDSDEDSSESASVSDSPSASSPAHDPFGAQCMLPSIASSFPNLPSLMRGAEAPAPTWANLFVDPPQPVLSVPMPAPGIESQGPSGPGVSFPSQQAQLPDPTPISMDVDMQIVLRQDVDTLKDSIQHVLYALKVQAGHNQAASADMTGVRQQLKTDVDVLREHMNATFRTLKQDIAAVGGSGHDEWDRLRASVRAEFPDGLRDRVVELEAGLRNLSEVPNGVDQLNALRTELQTSKDEVAALKSALTALENTLKTLNIDTVSLLR